MKGRDGRADGAREPTVPASNAGRRPTMEDVAARVGVSRALVSVVFRGAPGASARTRERVLAAAEEIGYRPDLAARTLASSRSRVLGVMLTLHNTFHADLVEAMYAEAEEVGYDLVLSAHAPTRHSEKAVGALLGHRCDALVLLGPETGAHFLADLVERVPVVSVGRRFPGTRVDTVTTAEGPAVRQALNHLRDLGHRDIAHLDGGGGAGSDERRRSYRDWMRRVGLADHVRVLPGDHTEASGAEAAHRLLAGGRVPTALFAGNDRSAIGFLDAITRAGVRVPEDISLVGYDDIPLAGLAHIQLTTVRQDSAGLAREAVRLAIERLEKPSPAPRSSVLEPELVVRGTTAAPRAGGND
ncbi:LacI family DNA-binding transcriptional regulator [Nocardiopsis aegyptia]|uniref:DNA-binding LacI/PurR family transcriptional regulator n=1 Tax=Nocardiopsis aegyptia TaxID=220378 RepID=A0A7Z0EM39_9ACTN|nr:LacI family DNA-binding transcriptional regulator [Nocardiopsis aegyptia]NYJ34407.1 DNA-binding LacI/PurR family transcriptional regulator [Nocardiopsis aegyptia]